MGNKSIMMRVSPAFLRQIELEKQKNGIGRVGITHMIAMEIRQGRMNIGFDQFTPPKRPKEAPRRKKGFEMEIELL